MSHHLVECREVSFTYPDGTPALRDISFRITHGEAVAVIGANGAGKSTLLLHLAGVLLPQSGTVRVGDVLVDSSHLDEVRRTVGFVFQNPDDQLFMPTVFEDVAFGPRNLGIPEDQLENRVLEALRSVGADHVRDRAPYHLSGGEKRAVSIATVLALQPKILVLDEPAANLDPVNRRKVIRLLTQFSHTRILATHDLDLALDVCDRVLILHQGRITADGNAETILRDENILRQNGLELPLRFQGPMLPKD
ncbi:MAG: ABC transporter ATP-binding protein [Candidatus Neomarinimicrobiota bacterium]|nr:MAG: ABC transporter ATP-binding protein [Candidatus Neomarinimicrobiota bacterium]